MTKKVLIIDDEKEESEMLASHLESYGFQVVLALDGEEGLKKIHEVKPDIVLLDLRMPKLDGFEVCELAKGNLEIKDIPIIILTGISTPELDRKLFKYGASDILSKPYDTQKVIGMIRKLAGE